MFDVNTTLIHDINIVVDTMKRNEIVAILKNDGFLFPVTRVRVG